MPETLRNFIKKHTPENFYFDNNLNEMITHLNKHAPSMMDTLGSKHYSGTYKKDIRESHRKTSFVLFLIEYLMLPLSPRTFFLHPERKSFWERAEPGMDDTTVDQNGVINSLKRSIYLKYMPFKSFGHGNCCARSSYAGINLHGILSPVRGDIKIVLKSYMGEFNVDQFVLKIGNENIGWYIYDPLTNPEIIFEEHEYHEVILPMFRTHTGCSRPISVYLEITSDFVTHCRNLEPDFYSFFRRKFNNLNEKSLTNNTEFMTAIKNCRPKIIDEKDINSEAIKELADCLRVQDETLNMHFSK